MNRVADFLSIAILSDSVDASLFSPTSVLFREFIVMSFEDLAELRTDVLLYLYEVLISY